MSNWSLSKCTDLTTDETETGHSRDVLSFFEYWNAIRYVKYGYKDISVTI